MECDGFVRRSRSPLSHDRLFADGFAGHREPLFPFREALGFTVGVQQQRTANWTATSLRLQKAHAEAVQWWWLALSPPGPVLGQGRVIR